MVLPFFIYYAKRTPREHWRWCLVLGMTGNFIPFILFGIAQSHINSSLAGMLNALQPAFTLVVALLIFKRFIPRYQIIGVIVGLLGALLLLTAESGVATIDINFSYGLLVVLATFLYGYTSNVIKEHLSDLSALHAVSIGLGLILLPSVIGYWYVAQPLPTELTTDYWHALLAIFILALFSSVLGVVLFTRLIQDAGPVFASTVAFLIPMVAMMWGWLDGEQINGQHLMGIGTIFVGLWLINYLKRANS
jgi:drug/metabolite transporter (DMT)-like permease